jgi:subtilase family serine protease
MSVVTAKSCRTFFAITFAIMVAMSSSQAGAATGKLLANNTPGYVATGKNLGPEDAANVIEVSLWLQLHNRDQFDALTRSLYDRTSPNYRHWLTSQEFVARFAPSAQEANSVRAFLTANGLAVVKTGPGNLYVRARGTVAAVQKAFQVQLNNYQVGEKIIRANAADPYIDGSVAELVRAVSGLDTVAFEHPVAARQAGPATPRGIPQSAAAAAPSADFFSSQCFGNSETETFSTNNDGEFPSATYKGVKMNLQSLSSDGCAYTPPEIQAAYNLTGLYKEGFDGAGQTIAIVDWCGSPTIRSDANAFSARFGLPKLTAANFAITYTAPSLCIAPDQVEINIDVEWAHAVAPGAKINLVVPPSANFQDVDQAELDVVTSGLGTVLSGSFASTELYTDTTELQNEDLISEMGAAAGISMNFASGDEGTYAFLTLRSTVSAPADSPWSTAVGGVALALNPDNSIAWQAGWGNTQTVVAEEGIVVDPPEPVFVGGSGGGTSECVTKNSRFRPPLCTGGFPKPAYQAALHGKLRLLPDVAWLADPYTGVAILISVPGKLPVQVWQVFGGTSLATPMFSALWAIANQEAIAGGGTPLGQAAPYLYSMPAGTLFDIVPTGSKTNVSGVLTDANGTSHLTATQLAGAPPTQVISAIWDYPNLAYTGVILTFGNDVGLKTAVGWDNVTGNGVPNAQAFADYFFGK